jgi:hypothetical protein
MNGTWSAAGLLVAQPRTVSRTSGRSTVTRAPRTIAARTRAKIRNFRKPGMPRRRRSGCQENALAPPAVPYGFATPWVSAS